MHTTITKDAQGRTVETFTLQRAMLQPAAVEVAAMVARFGPLGWNATVIPTASGGTVDAVRFTREVR